MTKDGMTTLSDRIKVHGHSMCEAPCPHCVDLDGCHVPGSVRRGRKPEIVCLIGSTKFKAEYIKQNFLLTMSGKIVLSVGLYGHADAEVYHPSEDEKSMLDDLHKRKIDLCDWVLCINPGGYIGDSTRSELSYATELCKPILYTWTDTAKE